MVERDWSSREIPNGPHHGACECVQRIPSGIPEKAFGVTGSVSLCQETAPVPLRPIPQQCGNGPKGRPYRGAGLTKGTIMSKIKIDLDALRAEFPGVTDERLSHVVDFRSVKRPATATKVADAIMTATGAMEFHTDGDVLTVHVNNVISGGVEGSASWTGGKWDTGSVNGTTVKGAAEFVRKIAATVPETTVTVTPERPEPSEESKGLYRALVAVCETSEEVRAEIDDAELSIDTTVSGMQDTPENRERIKGETDRVQAALRAAEERVKARGTAVIGDSKEAFDDASDRIAAGLAIMEGPVSDTLPVAGPVPVVEIPEVIRTARHIVPPADLVIPFARRIMHVVRHHGNALDVPGALNTPARRAAVASAITVDLQDLCANVRDIDGMGTHLVDLSPEAVKLMDWARDMLGHFRSLALSGKTRGTLSTSKRKNVKARMADRFKLIMSPEFGETLNKRMADRA